MKREVIIGCLALGVYVGVTVYSYIKRRDMPPFVWASLAVGLVAFACYFAAFLGA